MTYAGIQRLLMVSRTQNDGIWFEMLSAPVSVVRYHQRETRMVFPGALGTYSSGDPTADKNDREVVALAMEESWRQVPLGTNKKQLLIGDEGLPFPVPLLKSGSGWEFDVKAGEEEVLDHRVGRNELNVIQLCRAYDNLQREYSTQGHYGKPAGIYAQKIPSTPGTHDGLYWVAKSGERPSPMGDLAAQAET